MLRIPEKPRDMCDPGRKGFTKEIFNSVVSALNISVVSGVSSDFAKTKPECTKAKVDVHLTGDRLQSSQRQISEVRSKIFLLTTGRWSAL